MEAAREKLRRRLSQPGRGQADELRSRLETRVQRLRTQFEWGDIGQEQYRSKIEETRTEIALLPKANKVVAFDEVADIVSTLPAAMDAASPEQLKQLVEMLVEPIETKDRCVVGITLKPAVLPFFANACLS